MSICVSSVSRIRWIESASGCMASFMTQRLQITARRGRGVCAGFWTLPRLAGLLAVAVLPDGPLAAAEDAIGTWILNCRDHACVLRHKDRLFEAAGIVADLEVRAAGTASATSDGGRLLAVRADDGAPLV